MLLSVFMIHDIRVHYGYDVHTDGAHIHPDLPGTTPEVHLLS